VPEDEQGGLDAGGLDPPPEPHPLDPGAGGVRGADRGLDHRTGQVRDVDGEAVPAQQGPPLAEGHPLERVEDVPGEEVLEPIAHPGLPRDTGRIPCVLVSLRVSHARK
jgi:hypothetical protein